ncbi:uncharacterized protein V1516DRAFT_624561 [Lipomyces oligophaga]|uniref:uncharacterized protein n=1 Tax=Lipomyces oligophaga TaxID=45792 RepID=UPI0034CF5C50
MSEAEDTSQIRLWRERLFRCDQEIIMSPQEYKKYFPYVDNVYKIHGKSTSSKEAMRTQTSYFQCRININGKRARKDREPIISIDSQPHEDRDVMTVDPAQINSSAYVRSILHSNSSDSHGSLDRTLHISNQDFVSSSLDSTVDKDATKRPRKRKIRETIPCKIKIKVVCTLDHTWSPIRYSITRTTDEGHSHSLDQSDKIVKNSKVLALFNPDELVDRVKMTARQRRAHEVETVLNHLRSHYYRLEESFAIQFISDKKKLDTSMRKWVKELQRITSSLESSSVESLIFS